ncbi:hypothetical protein Cl131_gp083 [Aphanizomenon phage vB_AphaS-CL131]|nr:hypothetical protein Cl131_gp083 [Aphanizomenon phage vB_AphaS-CL131]
MSNPKPLPVPLGSQFKLKWKSGKTTVCRVPVKLQPSLMAIAHCLDSNPAIADELLKHAQSLLAE